MANADLGSGVFSFLLVFVPSINLESVVELLDRVVPISSKVVFISVPSINLESVVERLDRVVPISVKVVNISPAVVVEVGVVVVVEKGVVVGHGFSGQSSMR